MVHTHSDSLDQSLSDLRKKKKKIGFVPTMGALHKGHMSLVSKALNENDIVVVSIFVNPTQFDNSGDLKKYPRTLEEDVTLLRSINKSIIVFSPEASDLYASNISAKNYRFSGLENEMEGKHRKGHFNGVGTVLNLLFRVVKPNRAYFGEKDFQQLQIAKKLVEIEKLPVKVIGCEIVREANGLAMSSRNKRLSKKQRDEAALINVCLTEVKESFDKMSISSLNDLVKERFLNSDHLKLEYFEIANIRTLKTAKHKRKNNLYRAFIAAYAGEVRLIDNMALN